MPFRSDRPQKRPRARIMAMRTPSGRLPTVAQSETLRLSSTAASSSGLSLNQSMSGEDYESLFLEERLCRGRLYVVEERRRVRVRRGGQQCDRVDDRRMAVLREGAD